MRPRSYWAIAPEREVVVATLSKTRFVRGTQCPNLLWWTTHEQNAPDLQSGPAHLDRLHQGSRVGVVARESFPGGVLIDVPACHEERAVAETRAALASDAPAIFEAAFLQDDVFVTVDVLERDGDRFHLIEVKSATSRKPEHLPDAAIQTHVVERSGVKVGRTELMLLNKDYRRPDRDSLFERHDVTAEVRGMMMGIEGEIERQLGILESPFPGLPVGFQCIGMTDCPFRERCWPPGPHHIRTLYRTGTAKALSYMHQGIHSVTDLPQGLNLSPVARRQRRAVELDEVIVEPGLWTVLDALTEPFGYLDFETVSRAVPVWPGVAPWEAIPVQFSYRQERPDGGHDHVEWLAEGPGDPREGLARALIDACAGAGSILVYSSYENTQIKTLENAVPHLKGPLERLRSRLFDLLPLVRSHVYHPDFRGSFSVKRVLPALVPEMSYADLEVRDGQSASAELARLLFEGNQLSEDERAKLRQDLLAYCARDTWAMVALVGRLWELGLDS
jgi:hypothetical protein